MFPTVWDNTILGNHPSLPGDSLYQSLFSYIAECYFLLLPFAIYLAYFLFFIYIFDYLTFHFIIFINLGKVH